MFSEDYKEVMKNYDFDQQVELTEHMLEVLELVKTYQKTKDETLYKEWQKKEEALLKKYREKFMSYKFKGFYKYFQFDLVIGTKDIYTADEYNKLSPEEQLLSEGEINHLLTLCYNSLRSSLDILYLQNPVEPQSKTEKQELTDEPIGDLPDKEITRSRQMLAIYYLLKGDFNIEHRSTHNVSDVAKFIHLLTGTKFSGLTNSEIYKKYKKIPSHKQGAELIKDLKFIRSYFESLQLKDVVALIDSEIQNALKEIPLSERKNYR